jgi:asparagine synthase (glutamine-hydrolysing)
MCGIVGAFEYGGRKAIDRATLAPMLSVIRHRGPDDEGIFVDATVGFGTRRLSIIDLAGGSQPLSNEDGTVVVAFNGEIYNYLELRQRLAAKGHTFRTSSDTEVIVHLYEDRVDECVCELHGMFAFAIWDAIRQRLFIARDRIGIKPLYYRDTGNSLIFGSEIKALLAHPDVKASLNLEGLGHYLSLKYVPAPETMFEGIQCVPPGHTLACDARGIDVRRYWRLSYPDNACIRQTEESCAERLQEILRESVRSHLISDVPFGAFLSGGVDSSIIVGLMSELLRAPVKTFSVGFEDDGGESVNELPYARIVAKRFGTEHHEVIVRAKDLVDLAEKVIWHLDQPIADNACLANLMVAKLASEHVKMVLTGEGGDELFAGYARYAGERLSPCFDCVPKQVRRLGLKMVGRLPRLRRPKLALFALCQSSETARLANWFPLFNSDMKIRLLKEDVLVSLADPFAEQIISRSLAETDAAHPLHRMLSVDTSLWLPDDLLARGDKMSMAASLEARVPLLDHRLVEFAATLPPHMKVRRLARKYLLKKVARSFLPPAIVDRKKEGFPMPFPRWFRIEARDFVRDLLSPATLKRRGLFNPAFVQKLLDEHEARAADHSPLIWGLIGVELWHVVFLDPARPDTRQTRGTMLAA